MKTITGLIALALCGLAIFSSCGNGIVTPPVPTSYSNSFYPLEVGNYWMYSAREYLWDTLSKIEVSDTVQIDGEKYFKLVATSLGGIKGHKPDTVYYRFIDDEKLVRYINGHDSLFIDFGTWQTQSRSQVDPGLVSEYPSMDSTILGRFDSCKLMIWGGEEAEGQFFVENIGPISINGDLTWLVRAKVGSTMYP